MGWRDGEKSGEGIDGKKLNNEQYCQKWPKAVERRAELPAPEPAGFSPLMAPGQ